MTTGTVRNLTNQIEEKSVEVHELRRELRELEEDLKIEVERVESNAAEASRGRSVRWEEIEWDIHCTETAISVITKQIQTLKDQLHEATSVYPASRIALE